MFERFTPNARHVVVLAQEEARLLHHNYIGTEHVLLGLVGERRAIAARVLDRFGMTVESARQDVVAKVGIGKAEPRGHIPFTPRAKKVLELALREALALHHNYIGTEHILLGMLRTQEGAGTDIIRERTGDLLAVRMAVLDVVRREPASSRSRGWLRRRGDEPERAELEPEDPEEVQATPAADSSLDVAAQLAGGRPVGSHHLLLATLSDPESAAARALASLGLDLDRARAALRDADVTGTSDETPEEKGRRHMMLRATDEALVIEARDPVMIELGKAVAAALAERDRKVREAREKARADRGKDGAEGTGGGVTGGAGGEGEAAGGAPAADGPAIAELDEGIIRADTGVTAGLAAVWSTLRDTLEDIRRYTGAATDGPGDEGDDGEDSGEERAGRRAGRGRNRRAGG